MWVLTPLYKEIGDCFMGDGWQSTSNRPILNILVVSDGFINVRRAVMDEQGQVLFDDLAWFAKKLCSVISSALVLRTAILLSNVVLNTLLDHQSEI